LPAATPIFSPFAAFPGSGKPIMVPASLRRREAGKSTKSKA
jgi:hypothetical protein